MVVITISDFSEESIAAALNLLGIVPEDDQILTVTVDYNNGAPSSTFTIDVNDELSDFNSDKSEPYTLSQTITLPNTATEGTLDLTIDDSNIDDDDSSDYIVSVDNEKFVVDDDSSELSELVDVGDHTIHVYNDSDDYTFTTSSDQQSLIVTLPITDGFIDANPSTL